MQNIVFSFLSDGLFKPKKRGMSKKEIKETNERVYKRLPEVTQAEVKKRRDEQYRTNRVRAQMFKQVGYCAE